VPVKEDKEAKKNITWPSKYISWQGNDRRDQGAKSMKPDFVLCGYSSFLLLFCGL